MIVGGCSEKDEKNQLTTKYENQLEEQQKKIQEQQIEIERLKEEIEAFKLVPDVNYRSSLQVVDREARIIMRLISEGKFDELKIGYDVKFEVKDGKIDFGVPKNNAPFPIEWASNFMYIGNFIKGPDSIEISYFIYNPTHDRSEIIYMTFDNDMKFQFIFVGDA